MRLSPSDPDVKTVIGRIADKSIDLQPNFQRGEVWPTVKKQRLIDSILRDWHVPPIHVVVDKSNKQLVLDGQQRLVAIRDFSKDVFPIDGTVQPVSKEIEELNGLFYSELPISWQRQFNQFTLRLFRITDYKPSEPGELFFRLNQPSALTAAEQRNAFFGDTREQVKKLVSLMEEEGLDASFWGFGNARMAYDDIIARTCFVLEHRSLKKKITASALADRYRSGEGFSTPVIDLVHETLQLLSRAKIDLSDAQRFNKATAQTWLIFAARCIKEISPKIDAKQFALFVGAFNDARSFFQYGEDYPQEFKRLNDAFGESASIAMLHAYEDRSTSRVSDISSVAIRDFVVWAHFWSFSKNQKRRGISAHIFYDFENFEKYKVHIQSPLDVEDLVESSDWGVWN